MLEVYRSYIDKCKSLFHPSGGFFYHYLYYRYGRSLWRDYTNNLHFSIRQFQNFKKLILVGSSAAYSLQTEFLRAFDEVVVLEPDVLATAIFRTRHSCNVKSIVNEDLLFNTDKLGESLLAYLEANCSRSNSLIFFSNILGQWPLVAGDKFRESDICNFLEKDLAAWNVLSVHDRYSFNCRADKIYSLGPLLDASFALRPEFIVELLALKEITDHQTEHLLSKYRIKSFIWNLRPSRYHVLDLCFKGANCGAER